MSEVLENFDSFPEEIRRGIQDLGWKEPMPVQQRVIPKMRAGSDVIVQAVTGSGKTGAFGLPIVERIDTKLAAIQALVLAPTRELAVQIANHIAAMGQHRNVEAIPIYGGTAYGPQLEALDRGVQVITGTPGRILDHLHSGRMKLGKLRVLIFDEADELLSLGFWPDMREIHSFVPKKRQTGLFSATIPERVRSLSRIFMHEPDFVSLTEGGVRSPEEIEHYFYIISAQEKDTALLRILQYEDPDSAIIFCNTRDDVRFVSGFLKRHGFDADMIQGEMTQAAREAVMGRIKDANLRFLVATDVAARGIDISDLSHVISYSAPDAPELYLHRTGRTGRAGKTGTALSLVSGLDIANFRNMQQVNQIEIPERKMPSESDTAERMVQRLQIQIEHDLREVGEREQELRTQTYLPIVRRMMATEEGAQQLAAVLFSYLRDRHSSAPKKREVPVEERQSAPSAPPAPPAKRHRRRRRRS